MEEIHLKPFTKEPIRFIGEDGRPLGKFEIDLTESALKDIYYYMLLSKKVDEKSWVLLRQGKAAFFAGSKGQEATQVGTMFAIEKKDWIFPFHRSLALSITRGFPLANLFGSILGKKIDLNKARQMPAHWGKKELNLVVSSSNVGTQILHAVGCAYGMKYKKEDSISLVFFGEGGSSTADFHAGMNFAGVYNLPVIFVCENNQWAITVPVELQTASDTIAIKSMAYGFEGYYVDGCDVLAVYKLTKTLAQRARRGGGPALIEALTLRYGPHSSADDDTRYRDQEYVKIWQEHKDPILRFRLYLEREGIWTEEFEKSIQKKIEAEINYAVEIAEKSPPPEIETLFEDVYKDMPWHLQEEYKEFQNFLKEFPEELKKIH